MKVNAVVVPEHHKLLVEEVVAALGERFQLDITEEGKVRETVNFILPSILAS